MRTHKLVAGWSEVWVAPKTCKGNLVEDFAVNLWDLALTLGSVRIEGNCRTPRCQCLTKVKKRLLKAR